MWSWIMLILFIAGVFIVWKIVKSLLKAFLVVSIIFLVVTGVIGFLMIREIGKFKEKFPSAQKLFVLQENGMIIAATSVDELDFKDTGPTGVTKEDLALMNEEFEMDNPSTIQGDHFIVFIMSTQFLKEGLPSSFTLNGEENVTSPELVSALRSDTPSDLLLKDTPDELKDNIRAVLTKESSEEDIRANFLMFAFSAIIKEKGVMFIIDQLKKDNLQVYPDYLIFSVVEHTPNFMINMLVKDEATS